MDETSERDRAAVEAGMEMIRWQLPRPATLADRVSGDSSDVWALLIVLVVVWVGAGLVIFNYVIETSSSWAVFITMAVIGAVIAGVVRVYRWVRPDPVRQEQSNASGTVEFTSTGVLAGDLARLWRARGYRLGSVAVEADQVVVDFGSGGVVEIPVPPALHDDVEEMARMLQARTGALQTEMLPDTPKPK